MTVGADRLLAIAPASARHAGRIPPRRLASQRRRSLAAWQKTKADHPRAGELVPVAESQLAELADFIRREQIISLPEGAGDGSPDAAFLSLDREHVDAGTCSSQGRSGRSTTSPTSIRPGRRSGRTSTCAISTTARASRFQSMRSFPAISCTTSIAPGRVHVAQVDPLSSTAFVEGWAHYCEQMVDAGFRKGDTNVRLGQLAESLIRLCRCIVGIRLHCEDMSVEQAVRFFATKRFSRSPPPAEGRTRHVRPVLRARTAGKLMLLKLREDYKAQLGASLARVSRYPGQWDGADLAAPRADARRPERRGSAGVTRDTR